MRTPSALCTAHTSTHTDTQCILTYPKTVAYSLLGMHRNARCKRGARSETNILGKLGRRSPRRLHLSRTSVFIQHQNKVNFRHQHLGVGPRPKLKNISQRAIWLLALRSLIGHLVQQDAMASASGASGHLIQSASRCTKCHNPRSKVSDVPNSYHLLYSSMHCAMELNNETYASRALSVTC